LTSLVTFSLHLLLAFLPFFSTALRTLHQAYTESFRHMKEFLDIPSLPPILATDVSKPFLDRETTRPVYFLDVASQFPQVARIMINTFELLESKAVKAISEALRVPHNRTPPISCIGPLTIVDAKRGGSGKTSLDDDVPAEYLTWLDSQPNQSVVFLCFGSLGLFTMKQLRKIAIGLEKSGQRFLWVVRNPCTY